MFLRSQQQYCSWRARIPPRRPPSNSHQILSRPLSTLPEFRQSGRVSMRASEDGHPLCDRARPDASPSTSLAPHFKGLCNPASRLGSPDGTAWPVVRAGGEAPPWARPRSSLLGGEYRPSKITSQRADRRALPTIFTTDRPPRGGKSWLIVWRTPSPASPGETSTSSKRTPRGWGPTFARLRESTGAGPSAGDRKGRGAVRSLSRASVA
jgi:hypothetical protein